MLGENQLSEIFIISVDPNFHAVSKTSFKCWRPYRRTWPLNFPFAAYLTVIKVMGKVPGTVFDYSDRC